MISGYTGILSNVLDHTTLTTEVISNNIANTNTPNYKAKKVIFRNIVDQNIETSLKTTREKHINKTLDINNLESKIVSKTRGRQRYDGNNVDQTKEMVELTKNSNKHSLSIESLNSEYDLLRSAIGH